MTFCFEFTTSRRKEPYSRSKHRASRVMSSVMLKIIFTLEPENETWQANSPYTRRRTSGCIVVLSNPWNWENCISRWNLPSGRTSKGPSRVNILGPRLVAQCRCPNNHKPIRRGNPLRRRDKLRYVCDYLTQARCGGLCYDWRTVFLVTVGLPALYWVLKSLRNWNLWSRVKLFIEKVVGHNNNELLSMKDSASAEGS